MNHRCAVFLLCLGTAVGISSAAPTPPAASEPAQKDVPLAPAAAVMHPVASDPERDVSLEIKIDTSRAQPYVGSGLGITAELKNKSKKTVLYFTDRTTTLTLPPEMEGPFSPIYGREAFFPSEYDQWRANEKRADPEKNYVTIAIQPGQSYRAAWVQNVGTEKTPTKDEEGVGAVLVNAWRQIKYELRYIFFPPGDYKVIIQAKVGVGKSPLEEGYYTFSEVANIKVASPQFVIIFGAMVGGLISWLLFPQGEEKSVAIGMSLASAWAAARKFWWYLYSICGACLLSAIVTILLARLSESQFLVKVSVTDFWGALVIGFVAQYTGKSILDRLIPGRPASQVNPKASAAVKAPTAKGAKAEGPVQSESDTRIKGVAPDDQPAAHASTSIGTTPVAVHKNPRE